MNSIGINPKIVIDDIITYTRNYIRENGLRSLILGISGGLDSTVVACLMRESLQDTDCELIGITMPTFTTKDEENDNALLGKFVCDRFFIKSLDFLSNTIKESFKIGSTNWSEKLRFGNIKARLRTLYLYDQAKKYGGMVIGTDNYTEWLLGFSTIGGDALADFMPIQYLWKTEVYQLAEWLSEYYREKDLLEITQFLEQAIDLQPQDGLMGGIDMDQIGAKCYQDVDRILFNHIELHSTEGLCEIYGYEVVDRVIDRYNRNFKRSLPLTVIRKHTWLK